MSGHTLDRIEAGILGAIVALLVIVLAAQTYHAQQAGHLERITEDDARWNCSTMGNRICGPVAP